MEIKIDQIIEGWKNYLVRDEDVEKLAEERMHICLDCDKLNEKNRCKVCGCFMVAKTRSKKAKCPLGKW